jgi:hypothetical protein
MPWHGSGHSLLLEVAMQNVAETVAQLHPRFYFLHFQHFVSSQAWEYKLDIK